MLLAYECKGSLLFLNWVEAMAHFYQQLFKSEGARGLGHAFPLFLHQNNLRLTLNCMSNSSKEIIQVPPGESQILSFPFTIFGQSLTS